MRSSRLVCDQLAKALRAACTARSTSAAPPRAILPEGSSVAGLIGVPTVYSIGSTHCPSI